MNKKPGAARYPRPDAPDTPSDLNGAFGELPSLKEARRRMRSKPGFFSSLTPEAKAAMLAYEGHENLGPGDYDV
jgi:hypothetical protein